MRDERGSCISGFTRASLCGYVDHPEQPVMLIRCVMPQERAPDVAPSQDPEPEKTGDPSQD